MCLSEWQRNGWLRVHKASTEEIRGLFSIVDRDLRDALADNLSTDWQFGIAYNAALKLCMILLHASGFRAEKNLQHFRTIAALPEVLGESKQESAAYLQACRVKRNTAEYDIAGVTSRLEADELIAFTKELRTEVVEWLKATHSDLLP